MRDLSTMKEEDWFCFSSLLAQYASQYFRMAVKSFVSGNPSAFMLPADPVKMEIHWQSLLMKGNDSVGVTLVDKKTASAVYTALTGKPQKPSDWISSLVQLLPEHCLVQCKLMASQEELKPAVRAYAARLVQSIEDSLEVVKPKAASKAVPNMGRIKISAEVAERLGVAEKKERRERTFDLD